MKQQFKYVNKMIVICMKKDMRQHESRAHTKYNRTIHMHICTPDLVFALKVSWCKNCV